MIKSGKTKVRKLEDFLTTDEESKSTSETEIDDIITQLDAASFISESVSIKTSDFKNGNDPLFLTLDYSEYFDKIRKRKTRDDDMLTVMKKGNPLAAKKVFNTFLGYKETPYKCDKRFLLQLTRRTPLLHDYGDCLIGASKPTKGTNFKAPLSNSNASVYIHHIGLAANTTLNSSFYSSELLEKVSSSKKGNDPLTLSHLCGNGGCGRPGHIIIEKKTTNETRIHCHAFLKKCKNKYQYYVITKLCQHEPKCFTNDYLNLDFYYFKLG